jgi:hypothetical protein
MEKAVSCIAPPWGEEDEAVLRYLARYVFRVAITNNRIVGLDDNSATIRYKQAQVGEMAEHPPFYLPSRSGPCDNIFKRKKPSAAVK